MNRMTEQSPNSIDFSVDTSNLYREEGYTDMKVASIRKLVPIKADGSDDPTRTPVFIGNTQLMTPEGPLPIQSALAANNFEEALEAFPETMKKAMAEVIEQVRRMQQQQQQQQEEDSRIIVPGR
jgi:hypothetical protein